MSCGVESMSRIPLGSNVKATAPAGPSPSPTSPSTSSRSQFEGAERIAEKWGITRDDVDDFGLQSQERAGRAWAEGRFEREVVPIDAPDLDDEGKPTGETHAVDRDEGLRETSLEKLAGAQAGRPRGRRPHRGHVVADLRRRRRRAADVGREGGRRSASRPRARIVDQCLVGVDPVLMLTGPIDATHQLLGRTGLTMADIDTVEINEAFASVVLAWQRELQPDPEPRSTPTAAPSPSATRSAAPAPGSSPSALHELERTDGTLGLVTMCCGGGLGTGTILERV